MSSTSLFSTPLPSELLEALGIGSVVVLRGPLTAAALDRAADAERIDAIVAVIESDAKLSYLVPSELKSATPYLIVVAPAPIAHAIARNAGDALCNTHDLHDVLGDDERVYFVFRRVPSYPRTAYLHGSSVRSQNDIVLSEAETRAFLAEPVLMQEKLDGFNAGIYFHDGKLRFADKSGAIQATEHDALLDLRIWAEERRDRLKEALGDHCVLYVEVLHLHHSIEYTRLPDICVGFDVFDRVEQAMWSTDRAAELCARCGVVFAPVLMSGRITRAELEGWNAASAFAGEPMEGVVLKREERGVVSARAKFVRRGFELAEHPRMWSEPRYHAIADDVRASARTKKKNTSTAMRRWLGVWADDVEASGLGREHARRIRAMAPELVHERAHATVLASAKGRETTIAVLRTGGTFALRDAFRAATFWRQRVLLFDPQPPGLAAEALLIAARGTIASIDHVAAQPERLAELLLRLHLPRERVEWIYPDLPASAPSADFAEWTLIAGDWRSCVFLDDGRSLDVVALEPRLAHPAEDLGRLLAHLELGEAATRTLLRAYCARTPASAAFIERVFAARDQRIQELEEDVVRAHIVSRTLGNNFARTPAAKTILVEGTAAASHHPCVASAPLVLEENHDDGTTTLHAYSVIGRRHIEAAFRLAPSYPAFAGTPGPLESQGAPREPRGSPPSVAGSREGATGRGARGGEPRDAEVDDDLYARTAALLAVDTRALHEAAIHPRAIIAWPEGVLLRVRHHWLLDQGVSEKIVRDVRTSTLIARMRHGVSRMFYRERDALLEHGISVAMLDALERAVPSTVTKTGRIHSASLCYPFPHTIVSYPWGRDAAYAIAVALARAGVRRLFFSGGCGLTGVAGDTGDLFIPTEVAAEGEASLPLSSWTGLAKHLKRANQKAHLPGRVHTGRLFNVDSILLETDAMFDQLAEDGYGAVEMETYGLARAAKETSMELEVALHVTDMLRRGKSYFFDTDARTRVYRRPSTLRDLCFDLFYGRV